ncbi:bifunctional adenosylcobinamide kinase/adenosylcobinamide-phosphate guanylyltransferase [Clostridia bacterium]|nr:bifunctional adenosylcobinamide kinase/adenosylcobinamide-phosphate guanylyltransferase [Clostridia bacterium]
MSITLVTGGARSGKSSYAEKICSAYGKPMVYIACGKITDAEMEDRIKKHQERRASNWKTVEKYRDFAQMKDQDYFCENDIFLLDCVTTMATNLMFDAGIDYDTCSMEEMNQVEKDVLEQFSELLDVVKKGHKTLVLVSNEVGSGVVPSYRMGRFFRDLAGRINQYLAQKADEVVWMVSGIPVRIKEGK